VFNSIRAALASTLDGRGVARLFSYQVATSKPPDTIEWE
jgi:hypothetical protein